MATRETVAKSLALLGSSLNLDVSDATVDAWELVLMGAYDEDLLKATVSVLKRWETTFLPPPAVILAESRKQTHRRMRAIQMRLQ